MRFEQKILGVLPGAVLALGLMGQRATAQGAEAAPQDTLETVTVTAERRVANLQEVPLTVSAISSQTLLEIGIKDMASLASATPGLVFQQSGNYGTPFLRGVGATTGGPEVEPSVAFYLDGVYLQSESSILLDFNNIDHIEVLKGPQGTLFGRNASGGVIQVVTKTPSQTPSVDFSVGYGNYNTVQTSLYATTGLTQNLAIDFAAQGRDQMQGWGRDLATGGKAFTSSNGGARVKLLWTPDDLTKITLAADTAYTRGDDFNWILFPGAKNVLGVATYAGFYNPDDGADGYTHSRDSGISLHVERDLNWARIVSISADRFQRSWDELDSTSTPEQLTTVNIFTQVSTFSQELQLLSLDGARVQWIAGLYFLHDVAKLDPDHLFGIGIGGPTDFLDIAGTEATRSYAGFGQATMPLVGKSHLTLGLRYTSDEKSVRGGTAFDGFVIPGTSAEQQKTWDKMTWRVALDEQFTPDVMGYVSYNRGFKSGSFSVDSPQAAPVKPEVIDAYEVGGKSEWLDARLRVNAAAFFYDVANLQVQELNTQTATEYFTNAASSKIYGVDLDAQARLTAALSLSAGLEGLHARYRSFPNAPAYVPSPVAGDALTEVDASGRQINSAPDFSGFLELKYGLSTAVGKVDLTLHGSLIDSYPVNPDGRLREPSVTLLSGSVAWTLPGNHWNVRLWGANLLDRHYYAYASASAAGDVYSPAAPRTFGIIFGTRW